MAAPTLLVGLGGAGSEIVQKVFQRATEKQKKSISFVVLDTDVNELRLIEDATPQIRTIQTSAGISVGEYLKVDDYAREQWFPVNRILTSKSLTEGAGQVRATSRLALNTAIQQGRLAPLNEAIESLYKLKGTKTQQAPRVIMAGSLCGGTGSGLILPVAMYIRNFLTTRMQQSTAIIRGFFLLPEVFDGVIKTQSERNNLRSNAYAAVREINAFLMKGDGALPEKYDLHFMAPRAGYSEPEEYTGRPMDFCFLFDAQNINGMKLNSTAEYKEHAANCIYGMAVAPTSQRSNSSEDNVIRELVASGGRNRFAGAGTSMLIYPTDAVRRYLALKWTKESITDEWLDVDRRFEDEQRENRNRRRKGAGTIELDMGRKYVEIINEGWREQKAFPSAVHDLCIQYDALGVEEKGKNWESYIEALEIYIEEGVAEQKELYADDYVKAITAAASDDVSNSDDPANAFNMWYSQLLNYKNAAVKYTRSLARNVSYTLFKDTKDYTGTTEPFRMEYWMHENLNPEQFIHPSAVRYFLYAVQGNLKKRVADLRDDLQEITDYWESFEKNTFDLGETEDVVETKDDYIRLKHLTPEGKLQRIFHKRERDAAIEDLTAAFGAFNTKIEAYWRVNSCLEVFQSALAYIESLTGGFKDFYAMLERRVPQIDREISQIEQKFVYREGETRRFVCANEACLRGLAEDIPNLQSSIDLPSAMSAEIFTKVKLFSLAERKPATEAYFSNLFTDTILRFLEDSIMDEYGSIVDMDIISALEREGRYLAPDQTQDERGSALYARNIIEGARMLAKPFIESPAGAEDRLIPACAYSPCLSDAEIPGRPQFVSKYLRDGGGVPDPEFDRNIILFYESIYGLRANELSKFSPGVESETYSQSVGEYYKAYYELVGQIHPQPQKSHATTPHIDRWWHLINKLPDLDEESQRKQEHIINASFFWGVLGGYIDYEKKDDAHFIYKPNTQALDLEVEDDESWLVVSNGTLCDHLYEVLDAFTIYPRLVRLVNEKFESKIKDDLLNKRSFEQSVLIKRLCEFQIPEFDSVVGKSASDDVRNAIHAHLGEFRQRGVDVFERKLDNRTRKARSIFDLPLLMKYSVPVEEYHESDLTRLVGSMFSELRRCIERYCDKKDFIQVYGRLLRSQFVLFVEDVENGRCQFDDVFNDSIFSYVCKAVEGEFDRLEMADDRDAVYSLRLDEVVRGK